MCSILSPSLGVIGTHGEACSFSAVEVSGNEAATPNGTRYRKETCPGPLLVVKYAPISHGWPKWKLNRYVLMSNLLNSVRPTLLSCQSTLFDVDLLGAVIDICPRKVEHVLSL